MADFSSWEGSHRAYDTDMYKGSQTEQELKELAKKVDLGVK